MTSARLPVRLESMLDDCVSSHGMDVEEVTLTPAGRRRVLRVAVDQDGGVTLDDLAEVTRAVSGVLDASDVMGQQPYTLEVTSRGTDRPLSLPRHWRRNLDHLVKATLRDDSVVRGRLRTADETHAVLDADGQETTLAYDDVADARVEVELNRKDR